MTDSDGAAVDDQRRHVRDRYARIAASNDACCGDACDDTERPTDLGYSAADVEVAAAGADLSLGCGNPKAIADLSAGDTVLDLGSGGGFDCFLAAQEVGRDGHVVGVDMTPEMLDAARDNATANDVDNVEFRLGEIEHLPVRDSCIDVVISNCVVNLSPSKAQVFRECYRVLRPGGRLAISDVVSTAALPEEVRRDPDSVAACITGASPVDDLDAMLTAAGFVGVDITPDDESAAFIDDWDDDRELSDYVVSATIEARKPENA
ncbi:MAG: arsenite methyltransferase [Haloferacaceae archaeon]